MLPTELTKNVFAPRRQARKERPILVSPNLGAFAALREIQFSDSFFIPKSQILLARFFISERSRSALTRRRQPPTTGSARSAAPRCEFPTAPAHLRPRWRSPPAPPRRRLRRPPLFRARSAAREFPADLLRCSVSRRLWALSNP